MIETGHREIPISRQCELLGLSRSGYYYQPQEESPLNLHLMNLIDEQYTKMPFYGVDKMTAWLNREGYPVNVKRIRRLMRKMGLEAIYPKRNLSISLSEHKRISVSSSRSYKVFSALQQGENSRVSWIPDAA